MLVYWLDHERRARMGYRRYSVEVIIRKLREAEVERAHIIRVLEDCGWKVRGDEGAADRRGLKRSTLQSRMTKLGIQRSAD
jgi:transcriptional regulator with GAF, ATPase, and Fis domain